jgi:hypothetical protein
VFFGFFVLAGVGFAGEREAFVPIGGLMQRLSLMAGFAWVAILAWDVLRRPADRPSSSGDRAR